MSWNPDQYLKFAAPRLQPAIDLLARVPLARPDIVFDLGCGAATSRNCWQRAGRRLRLPASMILRRCWKRPPQPWRA